ncbi:hypothetical protein XENOCAPTIV_005519 [Xenoophorus captivus]|uniref:Secreted protein n=1 Tax=Xenoophorus captivus TaxID=1517983 RepID=A0ABV0S9Z5_9TELE
MKLWLWFGRAWNSFLGLGTESVLSQNHSTIQPQKRAAPTLPLAVHKSQSDHTDVSFHTLSGMEISWVRTESYALNVCLKSRVLFYLCRLQCGPSNVGSLQEKTSFRKTHCTVDALSNRTSHP